MGHPWLLVSIIPREPVAGTPQRNSIVRLLFSIGHTLPLFPPPCRAPDRPHLSGREGSDLNGLGARLALGPFLFSMPASGPCLAAQANSSAPAGVKVTKSPGFMHLEPTAIDCEFEDCAIFGRAAAVAERKRLVDLLDMDAALNWLDRVGDLKDPARGFWSAKGRSAAYFMRRPCLPCQLRGRRS